MRIVIAGAGEVGTHLAKMLSNEDQDIIVIDTDEKRLASLENYNLMTYQGSAIRFESLCEAGVPNADLFIAVTPMESRNILACTIAKRLGAKKAVARIDNDEYLQHDNRRHFTELGIDNLIYPEWLAAQEMVTALRRTWVRSWFELFDGELIVLGVKLRANSPIVGKRLREVGSITRCLHVNAIKRNRETIIPRGDDLICENDIVYLTTMREHVDEVTQVCGKTNINVESVLIMGGSDIAVQLAKLIQTKLRVKIIEADRERCLWLDSQLPHCSIVHGDASDIDLLEEEGLSDYDVFISLSDRSETNILGGMMAKEHGVRKTIAQVENIQFINEAETLNIGTIINKKLLASSRIFQLMLDADVDNAKCLALSDAEVAELVVKPKSKVTKADVKDLRLSRDMTIAGLVRDGKGELVTGSTRLREGDHVVVFCLSGAIHKIEKYFN